MPVWICAVVGAGVANAVPGAVFVAAAATDTTGTVARWQVSQLVLDGMCDVAPTGDVGGIATIWPTPAKVEPLMPGPWQVAQLLVIPAWFIKEPENFAPLPTGAAAMLEPWPTWQVSHEEFVGRWLPGRPTTLKPTAGIAKLAAAAPWHWAQLLVVLGALAWMFASVGMTEKSLPVWQALQAAAAAYGMWLAGFDCAASKVPVPTWQSEQSPDDGCAASATRNVPAAARGRVWKPRYFAPEVTTDGAIGYAVTPIQEKLLS